MNHTLKVSALSLLLALAAAQAGADQTNLIQDLDIQLTGIKQGPVTTNRQIAASAVLTVNLNTRQVINALGTAIATTFSRSARLVMVKPLANGYPTIEVRDGAVKVDVSSFFQSDQQSGVVTDSQVNLRTGNGSSTDYSLQRFALSDVDGYAPLPIHFDVRGIGAETSRTATPEITRESLTDVSGAGDQNGDALILQGSIHISGHTFEVVPSGPPPAV
jgi:hypothetical protein